MKRYARLPVFALLTLLSGCYSTYILEFDALKPAKVDVSPAVRSLVVVARCDLDSTFKSSSISSGKLAYFQRDSLMSKQAVLGCSDALVESPRFDLYYPVVHRTLDGDYTDPDVKIPWDMIRTVSGDPPHDAVLSFEFGSVDDTLKYILKDGWLNNYQYIVEVKTIWRLYRLNDFQTKDFHFTDTITFDVDFPSEFLSSPDQAIECLKTALYDTGVQTARRLAPWWLGFERYYFPYGPGSFAPGVKFMKEGKWLEAAEIWRTCTESKNKNAAAKACFNMSVACEMANNITAALEWLKKAEKLGMHQSYIKEYETKLVSRKAELEKLDLQMK